MKYYRYMSIIEFLEMIDGKEISPIQTFEEQNTGDANGVCFLCEETKFNSLDEEITFRPEDCLQLLKMIATNDVLVEFEASTSMRETWGQYADPFRGGWDDTIIINEYRVDSYSNKTLKPIRFSIPCDDEYNNSYHFKHHEYLYDENLPNEIKWFEMGEVLSIPDKIKNSCTFESENIKVFEIPEIYSEDPNEDFYSIRHLITLCHLTNHIEESNPCIITLNGFDGRVIISKTNDENFSLKDDLLNRLEDFSGENFERIKKNISKFGTDESISFKLSFLDFDENDNKIYDMETFRIIVDIVSDIMENSKKKEISIGD